MIKKGFLISIGLLLISGLVLGCGIPQEEHDAVLTERDETKAQLNITITERDDVTAQLNATITERDEAKAQLNAAITERDEAKTRITALGKELLVTQAALETADNNYGDLVSNLRKTCRDLENLIEADALIMGYWADAAELAAGSISESEFSNKSAIFIMSLSFHLSRIGNESLSQHWQNAVETTNDTTFYAEYSQVMNILTGLIEEKLDTLSQQLEIFSLEGTEA